MRRGGENQQHKSKYKSCALSCASPLSQTIAPPAGQCLTQLGLLFCQVHRPGESQVSCWWSVLISIAKKKTLYANLLSERLSRTGLRSFLESAVLPLVRRVTAALSLSPLLCDCESNLYPYYCFGSADSPVLKRKWRCAALSCRAWMQVVLGKVCGDMELQR